MTDLLPVGDDDRTRNIALRNRGPQPPQKPLPSLLGFRHRKSPGEHYGVLVRIETDGEHQDILVYCFRERAVDRNERSHMTKGGLRKGWANKDRRGATTTDSLELHEGSRVLLLETGDVCR